MAGGEPGAPGGSEEGAADSGAYRSRPHSARALASLTVRMIIANSLVKRRSTNSATCSLRQSNAPKLRRDGERRIIHVGNALCLASNP
jgi:hypothetical protein